MKGKTAKLAWNRRYYLQVDPDGEIDWSAADDYYSLAIKVYPEGKLPLGFSPALQANQVYMHNSDCIGQSLAFQSS